MDNRLLRYREIWKNKKILRLVYSDYYKKILSDLRDSDNKTLELGSGIGNFKEFKPDVISSDIDKCDWLDMCFDAHKMPFIDNSLANIVMIDVLHHLADPIMFLREASRVLEKGGRIIILEPFPSFFSLIVYKLFHPEPFLMKVDYFNYNKDKIKHPWDANQAIPYLIFFKHLKKFESLFKGRLRLVKKEKLSLILYPLTGGFENKQLIPDFFMPFFLFLEKVLQPLKNILAFRCYIILEKE